MRRKRAAGSETRIESEVYLEGKAGEERASDGARHARRRHG